LSFYLLIYKAVILWDAQGVSNLREFRREEAFQRLDAVPIERLRHVTWTRAAALGGTTVAFVQLWVELRGYHGLIGGCRATKVRKPKTYADRSITDEQQQRLRLIAMLLCQGKSWREIGENLGTTRQAAHQFWQVHRHHLTEK